MEEKEAYLCDGCGKYMTIDEGEIPDCCGNKMRKVPIAECIKDPAFAEHARNFDNDEPCDDGTG